ncbi:MAG: sigma 54-interacting transcriptional regulator [Deltaproteobacteria bacterium]|nr:sigma 54-interacting transcriptional regulator [Deltaproteobacteria bacterium]
MGLIKDTSIPYELVFDSISEGVFTVDANFDITSFNRSAEAITGFKKHEAIGKRCFEIFRTSICESGCFLKETMETGKNIVNRRIDIIDKRGGTVPIAVNTAVLKDKRGRVVGGAETFRDCHEVETLKKQLEQSYTVHDIIGKSPKIKEILSLLPDIAASSSSVLIDGPSGSGKEIFTRAIHNLSLRKKGPFVAVNCGAIPHTLLETEFFGHVKGAFTDAKTARPGKFKIADGGTIFLDEIGDLPLSLQVKLLRVIQEKEYEPVGAVRPVKTDVRLVLATNKNLVDLVKNGSFRDDLYFRINVVKLSLPALCERREDIPLLVDHFIGEQNHVTGKAISGVNAEVLSFFMDYAFPGNIRELKNIIEYAFILCHGRQIEMSHLPKDVLTAAWPATSTIKTGSSFTDAEAALIKRALVENKYSRKKTAEALGIDPSTLWRKLKRHRLL